ncbi:MAG: glutathione synthase [Candidatus Omnitrophica bacterium]|nr:glutathione synthase [Candidatus Omnitrophota bacterium]MDD5671769.1 glutathione synthase [Candidatus Omnitrophota bacterium]
MAKRILFVMDPLEDLSWKWDNSLNLLREFAARGHTVWASDSHEIRFEIDTVMASTRQIYPAAGDGFKGSATRSLPVESFDLVLIRKNPPFDFSYLYLTYLLELVARRVPVSNHPRGIRNANEKLSVLNFPKWIPKSIVSCSTEQILRFKNELPGDLVLKPLHRKGGEGIVRLRRAESKKMSVPKINKLTLNGKTFVIAQEFIESKKTIGDKRIVLLNGEILVAYEKHPPRGDFRSNLGLGGTWNSTQITAKERRLVRDLKPYLVREGLHFAGIDVMEEKLLEINVTSPAGLTEARTLYPRLEAVKSWADFLESL